ncbi:MAG: hypothetical protein KJ667_01145, partial [Alphaproteobacteria bacterium]|nr:hypothetical protein [Alphaproteobacteria bacterium]
MFGAIAAYAAWRMTRRAGVAVEETAVHMPVAPGITPVGADLALEYAEERTAVLEAVREAQAEAAAEAQAEA